jgi:hypothetical protein
MARYDGDSIGGGIEDDNTNHSPTGIITQH